MRQSCRGLHAAQCAALIAPYPRYKFATVRSPEGAQRIPGFCLRPPRNTRCSFRIYRHRHATDRRMGRGRKAETHQFGLRPWRWVSLRSTHPTSSPQHAQGGSGAQRRNPPNGGATHTAQCAALIAPSESRQIVAPELAFRAVNYTGILITSIYAGNTSNQKQYLAINA